METTIEIHAGDGGVDAEKFAGELASAFVKSGGGVVANSGRVITVTGPPCL